MKYKFSLEDIGGFGYPYYYTPILRLTDDEYYTYDADGFWDDFEDYPRGDNYEPLSVN